MYKFLKAILIFLLMPLGAFAQDSSAVHQLDTVVLRKYDNKGRLTTTTWIGEEFRYEDTYYQLGEPPTYWDTLEAFQLSGVVYEREYFANGKLQYETKQVLGEEEYFRAYYYADDSVFGYDEYKAQKFLGTKAHVYEFWPDSSVRIIAYTEKFKKHGRYQTFYRNGNRQCDCNYKNGERDSLQTMYYENGQLKWKLNYKEGKVWDVFVCLDPQGNELEKGTLKDGNGTLLTYDENGKLIYTEVYKNGKLKNTIWNN